MVFSSAIFLVWFLPAFVLLYLLAPTRFRNVLALLASTAFYAWGAPLFVFVVYGSMLIDFWLVGRLNRASNRKQIIWASVILNVGLLAYFKYSNFFVENLNGLLSGFGLESLEWTAVVLPIGISFFTFQKLSYTFDVYKGKHEALNRFSDYALYIILFPQLIAGPIVRFNEIADQLIDRSANENVDNRLLGFFRFCIGLSKKVLIANVVGELADWIFALPQSELSTSIAWVGLMAYTFQIYFDFSGYSDMAIGLGRMMGFVFPENFNSPYVSASITEFWKRWHMTLSRWMKDYIYIPLGGNRKGERRTFFNLWAVFLISGLWHGASWTFVIWGAYHGLFLVLERLFLLRVYKRLGKLPSVPITFLIAALGWVLFRSETITDAAGFYAALFRFEFTPISWFGRDFWVILILAAGISFAALIPSIDRFQERLFLNPRSSLLGMVTKTLVSVILFILCLSMVVSSGFNPFIYFRF